MLLGHQPARHLALSVLRFPLTLLRAGVQILIVLPHLPTLQRTVNGLETTLVRSQLEVAQLQEELRHEGRVRQLTATLGALDGKTALVIGRSTIPTQHILLLNLGGQDGVTLETTVASAEGIVGRITEVHPSTSVVTLLTDPDSRIAGLVERSRETGLLVGRGRGQCEFTYLSLDADIAEGDRIVTAGLGGSLPKGLVLGTVTRVIKDEEAGAASAWVKPAVHLGRLEEVLCLPRGTHVSAGGEPPHAFQADATSQPQAPSVLRSRSRREH